MKKLLLGAFLLVSALSFSATRKVPAERIIMDQTTGIAYVQGEQVPFTGEIEVKFDNGQVQALMEIKDGLLDGKTVTYFPNGKVQSRENYKGGYEEGVNIIYYDNGQVEYEKYVKENGTVVYEKHYHPTGKLDFEATYKNEKLDGIVKKYDENGEAVQQGLFKDGVQIQ